MSVKDVKNYYEIVKRQVDVVDDTLKKLAEEISDGLQPMEKMEVIQEQLTPLIANYQRVSYIMFLLNKPTKKNKQKKYNKQYKKQSTVGTQEEVVKENEDVISDMYKTINTTEEEML